MSKHPIERPGHAGEIQRVDEQPRVSDLPAAVGADEAPKLLLAAASLPGRLLLQGAERSKLALGLDDLFHTGGTQAADQLVLQVGDAHVEPECFQVGATHWHHGDTFGGEIATTARSERLERDLVAGPLDQQSLSAASQRLGGCQLESLPVGHLPSLVVLMAGGSSLVGLMR
jgi:hypothetical protein